MLNTATALLRSVLSFSSLPSSGPGGQAQFTLASACSLLMTVLTTISTGCRIGVPGGGGSRSVRTSLASCKSLMSYPTSSRLSLVYTTGYARHCRNAGSQTSPCSPSQMSGAEVQSIPVETPCMASPSPMLNEPCV